MVWMRDVCLTDWFGFWSIWFALVCIIQTMTNRLGWFGCSCPLMVGSGQKSKKSAKFAKSSKEPIVVGKENQSLTIVWFFTHLVLMCHTHHGQKATGAFALTAAKNPRDFFIFKHWQGCCMCAISISLIFWHKLARANSCQLNTRYVTELWQSLPLSKHWSSRSLSRDVRGEFIMLKF